MPYIFLFVGFLIIGYLLLRSFAYADPKSLARNLRKFTAVILLLFAGFLAIRGGIWFAIPLALYALRLMTRGMGWGMPRGFRPGNTSKSGGQTSEVNSQFLQMTLDHDSGAMFGRVLKGLFEGQELSELNDHQLLELWRDYQQKDRQSAQLIEAFLDREREGWRDRFGDAADEAASQGSGAGDGPMTIDEAFEILGLQPGAQAEDINKAHRALMKKFHPDQGGSTYIAAKINQAKEILLNYID